MNVFLFGGSFNPPHIAHVLAISYLLATEEVDQVLVVPCFRHAFSKSLVPYVHRFAMCERAIRSLPKTTVSRVEEEIGGESRTLRTVEHLHARHPDWHLRVVIGSDVLLETERWYAFDQLLALAPPLVLGRPGVRADGAPRALLPDISSTEIRDALLRRDTRAIEPLLPRGVLDYIETNGLYRAA